MQQRRASAVVFRVSLYRPILIWLVALALTGPVLADHEPAPNAAGEVARTLLDASGEAYLRARDRVLEGAPGELGLLRAHLTRAGATDSERTLEAILRVRSEDPAAGRAIDDTISECLRKGQQTVDGQLSCQFQMWTEKTWPLCVELIWKRDDLPMRWRFQHVDGIPYYAIPIDPLLVILRETPQFGGNAATVLGRVPGARDDPRVYPALVEAYKYARTLPSAGDSHSFGLRVLVALGKMGTARSLESIQELERFERDLMVRRGQSPWNDAGSAEREFWRASRDQNEAISARGGSAEEKRRRIAAATSAAEKAEEVYRNVRLWQAFDSEYRLLGAKGIVGERAALPTGPALPANQEQREGPSGGEK